MPARRIARLIAVVAGIAGVVLCALVPLLPVKQTTATIPGRRRPAPTGMSATSPRRWCPAPRGRSTSRSPAGPSPRCPPAGGLVFSTMPPAGIDASRNGLFVRANADVVVVAFRDSVAAVAPRPAVAAGACSTLHIWANAGGVGADFVGIPGATGTLAAGEEASGRRRLHRPEGGRAAGAVGAHRRRHPVHHVADAAEARR